MIHPTDPAWPTAAAARGRSPRWFCVQVIWGGSPSAPESYGAAQGLRRFEEVITYAEAVDRLTRWGYDRATAQTMLTEYLHETSRDIGVPVYQWGLDGYDLDAIIERYDWMADIGEGGTTNLAQAREAAALHAAELAGKVAELGPIDDPGYARGVTELARKWAERARVPEPFTHAAGPNPY